MIKAWENFVAVKGFELRVQILLLIRCINELMKTCSVSLVGSKIAHRNYVPTNLEILYG